MIIMMRQREEGSRQLRVKEGSNYSKLSWGRYESRYEKRDYRHAKTSALQGVSTQEVVP